MTRRAELEERIAELRGELADLEEEEERTRPRDTRPIDPVFEANLNDLVRGTLNVYPPVTFKQIVTEPKYDLFTKWFKK